MKNLNLRTAAIALTFFVLPLVMSAQKFADAGEYLNYINTEYEKISADMWDYTSAVAHGKSARKVDKRRNELISTTAAAVISVKKLPDYDGYSALRDTVLSYLDLSYTVLTKDYAKIMDMEEIAEQSYDLMEAYLLAQDKANEKLKLASDKVHIEWQNFAKKFNITLIENKDKIDQKLDIADKVFDYYHVIYLIFFKSYKQEMYLLAAITKGDMNALEQNKNTLSKFAAEGLQKLDTVKSFKADPSVKDACKKMLDFYKNEADEKVKIMSEMLLKKENFDKIKKAFDAIRQQSRTQADIDQYNNAVNDLNNATNKYNQINQELNNGRSTLMDNWNSAVDKFLDKHVPKRK